MSCKIGVLRKAACFCNAVVGSWTMAQRPPPDERFPRPKRCFGKGRLCGALPLFGCAESRPKAAATQRAAPTARRLGCHQRKVLILKGFGQHKALQIQPWIAAPRPGAARLRANIQRSQRPPAVIRYLVSGGEHQFLMAGRKRRQRGRLFLVATYGATLSCLRPCLWRDFFP
jgi:hypothetical protein